MRYTRDQFTQEYYMLWELGLLLPVSDNASLYTVKYQRNRTDDYARVTLSADSVCDALERACYATTYASPWRPEDIDLNAVYDSEENLLWIDETYSQIIQNKYEFKGMARRDFILKFGLTSAAVLFGLRPTLSMAANTTISFSGAASGFTPTGEQLYTTSGSYNWIVPSGVTSVSVVCIGGGGGGGSGFSGGGGGGALCYGNSITVTPGASISLQVGAGGGSLNAGGQSVFFGSVIANGGGAGGVSAPYYGAGGVRSGGNGGGNGGDGGAANGGGGAGGYSGDGGAGASAANGAAGSGGGGGGGGGYGSGGGGGGVGIYGIGASGVGGTDASSSGTVSSGGGGGSGGSNGGGISGSNTGGAYGGGGGYQRAGGSGAIRIIWGAGRSFPNNAG